MIDDSIHTQRIDLWLWHARICKTRSISTAFVKQGYLRLNSNPICKPASMIKISDVLTFPWHDNIRVVEILHLTKQRSSPKNISMIYKEILENSHLKD